MRFLVMPTINFFLRSNKDKSATFSLYCRVSYNGTKVEFSTGEKLDRTEFDSTNQKCLSRSKPKRIYIESMIESIRYKAKMYMLTNTEIMHAKQIVELCLIPRPKQFTYIDTIIQNYIDSVQNSARPTTIKNHKVKLNHFLNYQRVKNHRFSIEEFNLKEAEKFHSWIKEISKTEKDTNATRNILFIKMCLFKMMSRNNYESFPLQNYSGPKDGKPIPVFLNSADREILINWQPKSLYLRNVRDLFIFQCYTGLSFSDLSLFSIIDKNGIEFIEGKRFKNGNPYFVPLLSEAKRILTIHDQKLPIMTNEPYNRGLKEICAIHNIQINLTTHIGRKTFATMMNDRGVSRESVAIMLGHSSLRTSEQHYIGFSSERLFLELDKIG